MTKIKDTPKITHPRERFLQKGSEALSKSDLLAIIVGSGIKDKNVQELSRQIIKKFSDNFLDITVKDLQTINGIGPAKALQIVAAISLVKRFYEENHNNEIIIRNSKDVIALTYDLRDKKKEYLICLYLNARNSLIKKETITIGLLDKSLLHPREIFHPAVELNASNIILIHNHPMGIPVTDFLIIGSKGNYSFQDQLNNNMNIDYVKDGKQLSLFEYFGIETPAYEINIQKVDKTYFYFLQSKDNYFQLQNRRYLGNKYKLLGFIEDIISAKCGKIKTFCDIFSGTGVVGERFNNGQIKIISNDLLNANYVCLKAFLGTNKDIEKSVIKKMKYLNNLEVKGDNYFSKHFGETYFSIDNARKIGAIREEIENISESKEEKDVLICSLLYATDKVANTVGHYDAFRKKLDSVKPIKLLIPDIDYSHNSNNEIYKEDANTLTRKISSDVFYIDPPYNSRQYSDAYHLLENLSEWKKPEVFGIAKKMDRLHIKSIYCLKNATQAFEDLIRNANCKHILLSYNNTGDSKDGRSNARMNDEDIIRILKSKGELEIFEREYKAFTTGKSSANDNTERVFYCKVTK
jgi:adenine-specific DNA-methyltransferase